MKSINRCWKEENYDGAWHIYISKLDLVVEIYTLCKLIECWHQSKIN